MKAKTNPITPDAQVDALVEEAANPSLSRERVYFGDPEAEQLLDQAERDLRAGKIDGLPQADLERLEGRVAELKDAFRVYQVRIPNLRASRRVAKVLAPKLILLKDLAARAAVAAEGGQDAMALGLEALADMGPIVEQLADELPEILEALFESQGATLDWLDRHVLLPQVVDALTKQFAKLGSVEVLGKLLRSGGPSQ